jgi:myo-inositol-1(or 4)-monophosphatase
LPGAETDHRQSSAAPSLDEELALICDAVRAAGAVAAPMQAKGARSWLKAGDAPVTEADMAVDRLLFDTLTNARPGYGWLSEESHPTHPAKGAAGGRTFVVDPIDGTRGFIEGSDEWTICVALLEHGRPVSGAVFNPQRDEMFTATLGGGARCNEAQLAVSDRETMAGARLAASKKAVRTLGDAQGHVTARYVPSLAYRLAGVASGVYDGTISTGRAHVWDIAAAAIIVTEAGGLVTDTGAFPPVYTEQDRRVPPLVVAGPALHRLLCHALTGAVRTG